jgi:hypothetical protein
MSDVSYDNTTTSTIIHVILFFRSFFFFFFYQKFEKINYRNPFNKIKINSIMYDKQEQPLLHQIRLKLQLKRKEILIFSSRFVIKFHKHQIYRLLNIQFALKNRLKKIKYIFIIFI